jgi:hypothetical protein
MYDPYQASFPWRDYIPNYDGEQIYNEQACDEQVRDDSVDNIISDIFKGAAFGSVDVGGGGRGIFRDFVEFLESNASGIANEDDDAELRILLNTGSVHDVRKEMEDAELVVQHLCLNRQNLAEELIIVEDYLAKMGLVEKMAEVGARKQVLDGNLKKARKWLLALQTRHRELLVRVDNDFRTGGRNSAKEKYVSHRVKYRGSNRVKYRSYSKLWNRFKDIVSFTIHP